MTRATPNVTGSPRILLVRTSALGDIVHALPVLTALRRSIPGAKIGWVVDEAFEPLLRGHDAIDTLVPVPLRRWRRRKNGRVTELLSWIGELRRFDAEITIDVMGNHKGAFIARLSGARRRIGAARESRRERSSALWINEPVQQRAFHAVDRGLELLAPLGLADLSVDFAPDSFACGRDRIPDGDYLFVHPGAAWANKRYPPKSWGAVAAGLASTVGLRVLVGAAPGEESLADAVVAASDGRAERYDAPTLDDLAGAVRGARLVLAADTGATHLARAFGVPVVAVHGPTDPARHGPWNDPDGAIFRRLPCSFCHRPMDGPKACLQSLPPRLVVARAVSRLTATV